MPGPRLRHRLLRGARAEAKGPVLDIACGTGRVLLPVLQSGADAHGLDLFPPMLETARRKAAALGFAPSLHHGDMADFTLPRRYALIMITFNAFCHMLTTDDQLRCLGCIRRHLIPGGLLAFDGAFPGLAWIGARQDQENSRSRSSTPGPARRCVPTTSRSFDRVAQLQRSRNEVELDEADGTTHIIHRSEFLVRWTYKAEMELLLRSAGFRALRALWWFRPPAAHAGDGCDGHARLGRRMNKVASLPFHACDFPARTTRLAPKGHERLRASLYVSPAP